MIRKTLFSLATLLCLLYSSANASIIYIDSAHAGGVQSGSSWGTAFTSFQSGVNAANAGDSVWVAEGTYQPDSFFILKEGVKIFGGFQNTATSFAQRDYESNLTTLTGNSGRVIVNANNNLTNEAVLDGFTIENPLAANGGGVFNDYASPVIRNCIFRNNKAESGAAIYNNYANTVIENCIFSDNVGSSGGAIYSYASTLTITHSSFLSNQGTYQGGAIYCNTNSIQKITNCIFKNNTTYNVFGSGEYGGAICNTQNCYTSLINCLFTGNSSANGAAIFNDANGTMDVTNCTIADNAGLNGTIANGWTLNVYNSIISGNEGGGVVNFISWAESQIKYSLVQDVTQDNVNHNLSDDTDPGFTNNAGGDYHLNPGSACIDKGDDSSYQGSGGNLQTDSDLGGASRHQGMSIDIGAYEGSNITDNIGSTKPEIAQWRIGPNPTYGLVNIFQSGNGTAPSTITLSDACGRLIKTIPIQRKVQQISLAEFSNGLYFITTENGERFKIVKR